MDKIISGELLKKVSILIPDDVEIWIGMEGKQVRLQGILKDEENDKVIFVDDANKHKTDYNIDCTKCNYYYEYYERGEWDYPIYTERDCKKGNNITESYNCKGFKQLTNNGKEVFTILHELNNEWADVGNNACVDVGVVNNLTDETYWFFKDCENQINTVEVVVDLLNEAYSEIESLQDRLTNIHEYQRFMEAKIRRMRKVIKTLDNNRVSKHDADSLMKEVDDVIEENRRLKEALKNAYINEICENCKSGKYERTDFGEGDFECLKKHFGDDHWKCDGLKECTDFELKF